MSENQFPVPAALCIYPGPILARMRQSRQIMLEAVGGIPPEAGAYVVAHTRKWDVGSTITVAFRGGDTLLHERLAGAARTWLNYANVELDFGYEAATGQYRSWTNTDTVFGADIRVSFDQPGYWSLIGQDSIDLDIVQPQEASLNLGGFDIDLPAKWEHIVLHEFGHALGFNHEHQHPAGGCDDEFRWHDDPGYIISPFAHDDAPPCLFAYGDLLAEKQI